MTDMLTTRRIAEHLSTLASLLEAEACRVRALGISTTRDLGREAHEVRELCDRLWEADAEVCLGAGTDQRSGKVVSIGAARAN